MVNKQVSFTSTFPFFRVIMIIANNLDSLGHWTADCKFRVHDKAITNKLHRSSVHGKTSVCSKWAVVLLWLIMGGHVLLVSRQGYVDGDGRDVRGRRRREGQAVERGCRRGVGGVSREGVRLGERKGVGVCEPRSGGW